MDNKKCCNICRKGRFDDCNILQNNQEYLKLSKDKNDIFGNKVFEFKENFICDEFDNMFIEYPIEVSKINSNIETFTLSKNKVGKFVKIRPCADEYENKTFLGLYLGDLPISNNISHNKETKELNIRFKCNPAIFVFDLNKIVYGYQSWWGVIENEKDLNEISNNDIENIWYVKALKSL